MSRLSSGDPPRPKGGRPLSGNFGWMRRKVIPLLKLALLVGLAGLAALALVNLVVWWPSRGSIVALEDARPAQAALVLGAGVWDDGTPSAVLMDRLTVAYDLYRAGKVRKILCTGDHGETGYDEVNAMRRYLEKRGVPTEDVFMDHAGFDTYDSMYRARDVFGVRSAIVVTQAFHLPRALYLARSMGLEAQGVSASLRPYLGDDWYAFREVPARAKAFGEVLIARKPVFLGPEIPITGDGRATHG